MVNQLIIEGNFNKDIHSNKKGCDAYGNEVEIGLAKGKKVYEKREAIKEREAKRTIERAMKSR